MTKRKILIITYYWPPSGGVGVQRWLHFAKNLQSEGWEPVIYTPDNPQFDVRDEKLLTEVNEIRVIKEPIWEPFNLFHQLTGNKNRKNIKQGLVLEKTKRSWKDDLIIWLRGNLFIPDPRKYWVKPSVKKLLRVIDDEQISHIISTGPPHSMHLIGLGLKQKRKSLKWIADFRDPWSDWDVLPKLKTSKTGMFRHRELEKKVLDNADAVVTVSRRLADQFQKKTTTNVHMITNGISEIDKNTTIENLAAEKKTFTIGYFGMLNELRDPEDFWSALEELMKENDDFSTKLRIKIGGIVSDYIIEKLNNKFGDKVELLGYLPHEEVFDAYAQSDLLLLLLNKTDNARWILPMKFFEYLTANKPILSLGPKDSDLADLFKDRDIGAMLSGDHKEEIKSFLHDQYLSGSKVNEKDRQELLKRFSRSAQTEELGKLLDQL